MMLFVVVKAQLLKIRRISVYSFDLYSIMLLYQKNTNMKLCVHKARLDDAARTDEFKFLLTSYVPQKMADCLVHARHLGINSGKVVSDG